LQSRPRSRPWKHSKKHKPHKAPKQGPACGATAPTNSPMHGNFCVPCSTNFQPLFVPARIDECKRGPSPSWELLTPGACRQTAGRGRSGCRCAQKQACWHRMASRHQHFGKPAPGQQQTGASTPADAPHSRLGKPPSRESVYKVGCGTQHAHVRKGVLLQRPPRQECCGGGRRDVEQRGTRGLHHCSDAVMLLNAVNTPQLC